MRPSNATHDRKTSREETIRGGFPPDLTRRICAENCRRPSRAIRGRSAACPRREDSAPTSPSQCNAHTLVPTGRGNASTRCPTAGRGWPTRPPDAIAVAGRSGSVSDVARASPSAHRYPPCLGHLRTEGPIQSGPPCPRTPLARPVCSRSVRSYLRDVLALNSFMTKLYLTRCIAPLEEDATVEQPR